MAKERTDTEAVVKLVLDNKQAQASYKQLIDSQRKWQAEVKNMKPSDPGYKKALKELHALNNAVDEHKRAMKGVTEEMKGFQLTWKETGKAALAGGVAGVGVAIATLATRIKNAYGEAQRFRAILTNSFNGNSDFANKSLSMLQDFAATTPFQLDEVTQAYIKLVNRGFIPTQAELVKIGDLAASQGKQLDQYVEAILDAQTGEFERLKDFGIRASKEGDKVTLSFRGVTKEVQNTDEAIRNALLSFGEADGIKNAMASVSQTVEGLESNISDTWNQIFTKIGQSSEGMINGFYRSYSKFLDWINKDLLGNTLSEQMENERFELNKLEMQIRSANTTQEQRIALINKLKDLYPEHFKNIDAEKGYTEELAGAFKKLNNEYVNRIILQKQNEKFGESEERRAAQMERLLKVEVQVREKLAKMRDKFPQFKIEGKTEAEQLSNMVKQYNEILERQGKSAGGVFDPFFGVGKLLNQFNDLTHQVNTATKFSEKILSERDAIAKRLGINPEDPIELKKVEAPQPIISPSQKKDDPQIEKDASYLQNVLDKMQDAYNKALAERLEGVQSEEQAIRNKYASELRDTEQRIKDEKKFTVAKVAINQAMEAELETLRLKRGKEEDDLIEKLTKEASAEFDQFIQDRAAAQEKLYQALMTDEQKQILAVDQLYEALISEFDQYGLETTELYRKWEEEKNKIYKESKDKELKTTEEKEAEKRALIERLAREASETVFTIMANSRAAESDARLSQIEAERERELEGRELTKEQEEAINKRFDAKVSAERKRMWLAEQKAAIAQALINAAIGITAAWKNPAAAPFTIPLIIGTTAAQVAVIASQKAPQFAKGGVIPNGPSHGSGGIKLVDSVSGAIVGEMEGGEPIISRATYANNKDLIDTLLYSGQRLNGAKIGINTQAAIDAERMFRLGGVSHVSGGNSSVSTVNNHRTVVDNSEVLERLDQLISAANNAWNLRVLDDAIRKRDAIKDSVNG